MTDTERFELRLLCEAMGLMSDGCGWLAGQTIRLLDELERSERERAEAVDALADMVNQHAYRVDGDLLTDGGLSANEYAFDVLQRLGILRQPDPHREQYALDWVALTRLAALDAPAAPPETEVTT